MNLDNLTKRFSSSTENQRKAIFSTLFIAGNKLQTLFDNHIPEVSLKQFMLLSIIRQTIREKTGMPQTWHTRLNCEANKG